MKHYLLLILLIIASQIGLAQSLVYRPVNPSFGGDSFNYSWLMNSAQAQDKLKDPDAKLSSAATTQDPLAEFSNTLNRQILNSISQRLIKDQFGEEGIKEGTYQFGSFLVDVSPGAAGLIVRITDGKGGETSITVPYY
ncbi:curli production assembly/transport component CsgF [Dyadobacter sp. CY326]|uniref:curli production assembly/transport component CsgF n=1 Tax=Dyadobacter sp. CY326 TaxID=2907300 RepID=UPI001F479AA3|nr:curli production assembly/transport component CsgF [Dyadobacter sp. CY326]MCE7065093.1 curli assembly protein CsgF [Dyadobacter sp. CY326]